MNSKLKRILLAVLLTIGMGGFVHLLSLFTLAISRRELRFANPAYAVDLDQLFPHLNGAAWFFIAGWAFFVAGICIVYYLLGRLNKNQ